MTTMPVMPCTTDDWTDDPTMRSIVAYELVDGAHVEVGRAEGGQTTSLAHPYPVNITPSTLVES